MDGHAVGRVRELLDERGIRWLDAPAFGRTWHITRWSDDKTGYAYEVTPELSRASSNKVQLTVHNGRGIDKMVLVTPEDAIRIATDEKFAEVNGIL